MTGTLTLGPSFGTLNTYFTDTTTPYDLPNASAVYAALNDSEGYFYYSLSSTAIELVSYDGDFAEVLDGSGLTVAGASLDSRADLTPGSVSGTVTSFQVYDGSGEIFDTSFGSMGYTFETLDGSQTGELLFTGTGLSNSAATIVSLLEGVPFDLSLTGRTIVLDGSQYASTSISSTTSSAAIGPFQISDSGSFATTYPSSYIGASLFGETTTVPGSTVTSFDLTNDGQLVVSLSNGLVSAPSDTIPPSPSENETVALYLASVSAIDASQVSGTLTFDFGDGVGNVVLNGTSLPGSYNLDPSTVIGGSGTNSAVFAYPEADYSITGTPSSLTVSPVPAESSIGSAVTLHNFNDLYFEGTGAIATSSFASTSGGNTSGTTAYNFFGTGTSAILWENNSSDQVALWQMRGGSPVAYDTFATFPSGWQIVGSADFYGSGGSDLLWQNLNSDQAAIWTMSDASPIAYASLGTFPSGWQVVGVGDIYGTDEADILWRNSSTTQIALWEMNGSTPAAESIIGTAPTAWKVAGIADFNGDGYSDILWQNLSTGQVAIWEMHGSSVVAYNLLPSAPSGWTIAGTGDFADNGTEDILWENTTTNQVAVWQTNGAGLTGASVISNNVPFAAGWEITAVGDYTGSGADSILWQNLAAGELALWQTNGTSVTATSVFASGIPSGWQVAHNPLLAG